MTILLKTPIILNIFNDLLPFLQQFGWQSGFGVLFLYNIYLTVAWIKREKHIQLVEIAFENFMPRIKFELNKDDKLKGVVEENIKLKAENALLRKKDNNLPFIIIGLLFIAMIISMSVRKIKNNSNDKKNKKDVDKLPESEKEKLLLNDNDPFDLKDFNEKFKDMKFDIEIKKDTNSDNEDDN